MNEYNLKIGILDSKIIFKLHMLCADFIFLIYFLLIFSLLVNVLNARRKDGMLLIIYAIGYTVRNVGMGYIS